MVPQVHSDEESPRLDLVPLEFQTAAQTWFGQTLHALRDLLHPALTRMTRVELPPEPEPLDALTDAGSEPPAGALVLQRLESSGTLQIAEAVDFDAEGLVTLAYVMADDFGSQIMRRFVEDLKAAAPSLSVRDVENPFEIAIAALENLDLSFNDNGEPQYSILVHPETARKWESLSPTPEQEARLAAILDRKREEWHASRSRRKLPG